MWTAKFWKDAAERAVKTFVQALLATLLGGSAVLSVFTVDWKQAFGIALAAVVISVLTSLLSSFEGDTRTASLVRPNPDGAPAPRERMGPPRFAPTRFVPGRFRANPPGPGPYDVRRGPVPPGHPGGSSGRSGSMSR